MFVVVELECVDSHSTLECAEAEAVGECKNVDWAIENCASTCDLCCGLC